MKIARELDEDLRRALDKKIAEKLKLYRTHPLGIMIQQAHNDIVAEEDRKVMEFLNIVGRPVYNWRKL